jgi:hypothetical protein
MRKLLLLFLLPALLVPAFSYASRPGSISFSDGSLIEGELSLTPGYELTLHDGKKPHVVPLESVQEIRFMPENEALEQNWRFPIAGQAIKERWGEPFPVRHLAASLVLREGPSWEGHLHTLPLYVTATGVTHKLMILAKQRGKPGETLESLVYPICIRFADGGQTSNRLARLALNPEAEPGTALCAITEGSLVRLPARTRSEPGSFRIDSPLGKPLFVALQKGDNLTAAWKSGAEPEVIKVVTQAVAEARDFFDHRAVLGVRHAAGAEDAYALVDLVRRGRTTLEAEKSQPWRLEVWRFKIDPESHKIMLAARNWFFRGITEPGKLRAPVTIDETRTWTVAEPEPGKAP